MATEDLTFRFNVTGNAVPQLKRVQQQVSAVDRQIKRGNASLKAHSGQYNSTAVAANKFAKGALQQAGFQVGDFVVQVTNGTSAMQAFGQQGAQLAGVFGPIGAVVGAGIAIFSALAIVFEKSREASKELKVSLEELLSSAARLKEIGASTSKIAEIIERDFAGATIEVQALVDALVEAQRLELLRTLSASFSGVTRNIADAADEVERLNGRKAGLQAQLQYLDEGSAQYRQISDLLKEINGDIDAIGASSNDLNQVFSEIQSLIRETDPLLLIEGLARVRAIGAEIGGPIGQSIVQKVDSAAEEAGVLEAMMGRAAIELEEIVVAAQPLPGILSAAAQNALLLSQRLAAAPAFLQNMKNQASVMQSEIIAISSGFGQAAASAAAFRKERELYYNLENIAHYEQRKVTQERIDDEVRQFEANQKLTSSLTNLRSTFTEVGSSGGAAMTKIKEKTQELSLAIQPIQEKMKGIANTIENSMEGAFMSVVDGTKTVGEAFRSMAVEIIKELYRVFVVKQITGFITNAIGGYFNLNQVSGPAMPLGTGSVRPVARPSPRYEGGGYTGNGARAGGLDGKGGFMAMMHPRESVIDHTRGQSSGGVVVNQTINVSTGVQQTVRSEIRSLMPQIAESAKGAVLDAKRRGGSYGRAFA
jgi:predicted  nucleic acid-binding Zn-ribbon protein